MRLISRANRLQVWGSSRVCRHLNSSSPASGDQVRGENPFVGAIGAAYSIGRLVWAVLAESEIINLVSAGTSIEDILRGIYNSLAERAATLPRRVVLGKEITFVGGVAKQAGMVKALEERIGVKVHVPDDCDFVCAIGAAVLGERRHFAAGHPPRLADSRVSTAEGAEPPHTHA